MQSTAKTNGNFSFFRALLSGKTTLRFPDVPGKFWIVRKNSGQLATLLNAEINECLYKFIIIGASYQLIGLFKNLVLNSVETVVNVCIGLKILYSTKLLSTFRIRNNVCMRN